jgi:hypothetical protein
MGFRLRFTKQKGQRLSVTLILCFSDAVSGSDLYTGIANVSEHAASYLQTEAGHSSKRSQRSPLTHKAQAPKNRISITTESWWQQKIGKRIKDLWDQSTAQKKEEEHRENYIRRIFIINNSLLNTSIVRMIKLRSLR